MGNRKHFKFILEWPKQDVMARGKTGYTQVAKIFAETPVIAFEIVVPAGSRMPDSDQQKLAILELKMQFIKEVAAAEFTSLYKEGF